MLWSCFALLLPLLTTVGVLVASFATDGWAADLLPAWNVGGIPDLTGKVAIVTGPTLNGIGYETAVELARSKAHVVLAGRSKSKGDLALAALRKAVPSASAEFRELDLGSLASVQRFAQAFLKEKEALQILVNNAGVMMNPFTLSADGYESQFATNHLGHFLLTKLLLPALEKGAPSRVVTVSSAAAHMPGAMAMAAKAVPLGLLPNGSSTELDFRKHLNAPEIYSPAMAYGRSKLANVLFARGLDRRLKGKEVYSNALHPGGIRTNLAKHLLDGSVFKGISYSGFVELMLDTLLMVPKRGAVTQLYLATSPDVEKLKVRGKFYVPQAKEGSLPRFSESEEAEEALWLLSEELVKAYL